MNLWDFIRRKKKETADMNASRVTISPETLEANKLTPERKRELREQKILEYIKSKPAGTPIIISKEIVPLIGAGRANADRIIKQMVSRGLISREPAGLSAKQGYIYTVLTDVKSTKVDQPQPKEQPVTESTADYRRGYKAGHRAGRRFVVRELAEPQEAPVVETTENEGDLYIANGVEPQTKFSLEGANLLSLVEQLRDMGVDFDIHISNKRDGDYD